MPTQSITADKPVVTILLTPQMRAQLIPPAAEKRLAEVATVVAPGEGELVPGNLARLLDGATVVITGWGTPRLDEALLAKSASLKLVAMFGNCDHRLSTTMIYLPLWPRPRGG